MEKKGKIKTIKAKTTLCKIKSEKNGEQRNKKEGKKQEEEKRVVK